MERGAAIDIVATLAQHSFDLAHRHEPVAPRFAFKPLTLGPIGGVDPRAPVERCDRQPAIVGQRRHARCFRRRARLDQRVFDESGSRFGRLGQAERSCGEAFDAVRFQQGADLAQFARIVRGDHQRAGAEPLHARTASACAAKMRSHPIRARRSRRSRPSSSKGAPSAVACASAILPPSMRTKFASASAFESSG